MAGALQSNELFFGRVDEVEMVFCQIRRRDVIFRAVYDEKRQRKFRAKLPGIIGRFCIERCGLRIVRRLVRARPAG
jgi:hypothetical protein